MSSPTRAICSVAMLVAALSGSSILAFQIEKFAALEQEAAQMLRAEAGSFLSLAALVERLQTSSERAPNTEQRGRLALLWLRSVRSLLATIPFDTGPDARHREWLERHESVVVYSEPAGQWLIVPGVVWRVHDAQKSTPSAEAIAWFAVENGYPGECEGYIPCYANILNWLDGEYLRRHPRGAHASEAVAQVQASLAQAVKLLAGTSPEDSLNPRTDCGDLKAGLVPLRAAISASNAARRSETVGVIDELLARC
jgi:hypothetical protein